MPPTYLGHSRRHGLGQPCGICENLSPTHDLSQALTAGLPAKLSWVQLPRKAGDCRWWKQFMWTSSAEICDAMYDATTKFFPQFLTFKMMEESVAREDVPSNRKLMEEIRKYGAIYDKSCHECKDQREIVGKQWLIHWRLMLLPLNKDTATSEQTSPSKKSSSSSHLLQLLISSYISHYKDESKRKLALQQNVSIHITNETVENCADSICISRQFEYAGDPCRRCAGDPLNRSPNIVSCKRRLNRR